MPPSSQAVVARSFGAPQSFSLEPRDLGAPGPDEIRISVRASGISFVDVLIAAGQHQIKADLPFTPGSEFAGIVDAMGANVREFKIGDRVCAAGLGGGLAHAALMPAHRVLRIPDAMSFAEAAVFRVSFATGYHALVQQAALKSGEILLVLGAGGAVGYAAMQVGKALGAKVIASESTAEKRDLAIAGGADVAIDSHADDWRGLVKAAAGERGVDVVFDPIGDTATEPAFRSLGWKGRHLVIGFAGGAIPKLPVNLALLKGTSLIGVNIVAFEEREPATAAANLDALFALYTAGKIRPVIARQYPLAEFASAMDEVKAGRTLGRIIVTIG